jgi:hypothetical protein
MLVYTFVMTARSGSYDECCVCQFFATPGQDLTSCNTVTEASRAAIMHTCRRLHLPPLSIFMPLLQGLHELVQTSVCAITKGVQNCCARAQRCNLSEPARVTRHNLDVGFQQFGCTAAATAVSSADLIVLNCSAMSRRVKSGKNHAAHTHKKHDKKLRKQSKWHKSDDKDDDVTEQSKYSHYHKLASQHHTLLYLTKTC